MKIGDLDTHSVALKNRVELQNNLSSFDLNQWIFDHLQPFSGAKCLDLGCGRGNQSLPMAELVDKKGAITSIDLSNESLEALNDSARMKGIEERIETICSELDDITSHLEDRLFDRAVGSYSLYYVRDAAKMFSTIYDHLNDNGRLFFCGPSQKNNFELRALVAKVTGNQEVLETTVASRFMETESQQIITNLFPNMDLIPFENSIIFPDPERLLTYWRSHNLYDSAFEDAFVTEVHLHFEMESQFVNVKRGLGICASR